MRWIDITLPEPGIHQEMEALLSDAVAAMARIPEIQARDGMDAVAMVDVFAEVGQLLFLAVTAVDPEAFSPGRTGEASSGSPLGDPRHDTLRGYHVVAHPDVLDLPWHWLHNGVGFLLERHPICTGTTTAHLPSETEQRPWMQRCRRSEFLVAEDGTSNLGGILPQLQPEGGSSPRILFVPGHTDRKLRRLIYREAEAIQGALGAGCRGKILASLEVQPDPITPADLCDQGFLYQALHFAGPTSLPATPDDARGEYWMNQLIAETGAPESDGIESQFGLEGEVLGVDPITSLLDDVTARYELNGPPVEINSGQVAAGGGREPGRPGQAPPRQHSWLLDDGPVGPEHLGRSGLLPPFIFSNSFCSLPELGHRFLTAGASTFVGPAVPLFSRPARIFAGYFYWALGEGWTVGAAVWRAAQECRAEFSPRHPVWLSYGVQGYGNLALPYL